MFSRRRPAFTLLEILISIMAGAALCAVLLQAVFYFLTLEKRILRDALARERGQNVLSILEPRVLHAGLGLTWERTGNVFQRSFGGSDATNAPPPASWSQGPLQLWDGSSLVPDTGGVIRGRGISVLYAVPSALKASLDIDMTSKGETIELVSPEKFDPNNDVPDDFDDNMPSNNLRSWVTFPLTRLPVYVSSYSAKDLTIRARLADGFGPSDPPAALRFYDEMHYLRAERFQARSGWLSSKELTTSSWTAAAWETRLEGVLEMWFEWTPPKPPHEGLLEAWILTTGGESAGNRNGRPWEWPEEAPWGAEFERQNPVVTRGSWILRNLGSGS